MEKNGKLIQKFVDSNFLKSNKCFCFFIISDEQCRHLCEGKKSETKLRQRKNRILYQDVRTTAVEPTYGSTTCFSSVFVFYAFELRSSE